MGLGLLVLFAWLLVQWLFLPTIHLACLPVVDYDVLAAPPIRFVQEDIQAFADVGAHRPAVELGDLQTSDAMPTWPRRLEGCRTAGRDTLVLYVAGHGITEEGNAYLLCSDFLRRDAPGRYPLDDLLTELEAWPADFKLLVLDAGRLTYDARLGILVDELPRLLEDRLQRRRDPRLWVLTANGPFETSHVSSSARRSAFGYYLAHAFRGAADRDADAQVDLAELTAYVRAGVSQFARQETGGREHQTPQLLQAGVGNVATPPAFTLTLVSQPQTPAEQASADGTPSPAETPPGTKPQPSGSDPKSAAAEPERTAKTQAPAQKPAPESAASTVPAELREARRLLAQAWAARDRFQTRTEAGTWLPADYAPHVWREYQETLLGYEQRLWAGDSFQAQEIAARLQQEVLPLASVLSAATVPPGLDRGTVLGRLAEARRQFVGGEVQASYDQPVPAGELLREAVQFADELAFDVAYLVRWHAAAATASPQSLSEYPALLQLVEFGLPTLRNLLDELLTADVGAVSAGGDRQACLDELRRRLDELRRLREQIERDGIHREAQQLVTELSAGGRVQGVADRIDALLATPLLPAPLRQALLDARSRLESPFPPPDLAAVVPSRPTLPGWRRQRLLEQTQLEISLVAWADPDAAAGLEASFAAVRTADQQLAAGGDEAAWWQAWRPLGAGLRDFYRDLPARIRQLGQSADAQAARQAARLLRLVDARDAQRVESEAAVLAVPRLPRPVEAPPALTLAGPDSVELEPGAWRPLELTVGPASLSVDQAVMSIQYEANEIELEVQGESATDWRAIASAQSQRLQWRRDDPRVVNCRVRPRTHGPGAVDVEVSLTARGQTASHRLQLQIRAPEIVELTVGGPPLASERPSEGPDRLRLLPFPNRVTPYRFQLVNRSGKKRRVRVELWSQPPGDGTTEAFQLPREATGMLRPGFARLHGPLEMELPAEPTPVGLPFPPPRPPGGADRAEPAPPATAAASASPVDQRPVVSAGLVCLVNDLAQPERQWNTWIEFAVRPPRTYLDADIAYDPASQRIAIRVQPRDADGDGQANVELLPPSLSAQPIAVAWDTTGVLPAGTEMKDRAELAAPGYAATLFAKVEPETEKRIPVRLAIDGYPRAFLYQVRCDQTGRPAEPERSPCRIRITSPLAGDAFPAPAETLPIEFQVDAPEDAFQKPGDVVELGLDEDGDRTLRRERTLQWRCDRQVTVRLHQVEPDGQIQFHTEVTDFRVSLPAGGLRNKTVDVLAQLTVNLPVAGQGPLTDQHAVAVVLDGAPPVLRVELPARPVAAGDEIPVTLVAEELSGIAKGRVGLDRNASGELEDADQPLLLTAPPSVGPWTTALPTKDLPPGRYTLIVQATDRVGLSARAAGTVTVAAPRKEPPAAGSPLDTGAIRGRVVLVSRPAAGIRVTLEGLNRSAVSDSQGSFVFPEVPPGTYTLRASGAALNRFRRGTASVTVTGGPQPAAVEVQLE